MQVTDVLRGEHEVIQQVLDCLEALADRAAAEGRVDVEATEGALDFLANFADRCHHAKEERLLFPALNARGLPAHVGPVAVMLSEHELGRAAVARMRRALAEAKRAEAGAPGRFAAAASEYVTLLREHISKENGVLFPMADQMLGEERQGELMRDFERVEHADLGHGTHERYVELARSLCARLGVAWAPHAASAHACCGHASACR
jgi:hemerythrin-like domain-containing protein